MIGHAGRKLTTLIVDGRPLEPEHAIYLVVAACQAAARDDYRSRLLPGQVLLPGRVLIFDRGDITIGPIDIEDIDLGYLPPELAPPPGARSPGQRTEQVIHKPNGDVVMRSGFRVEPRELSEEVARRADVFVLGCVLWELLAGRRLFKGRMPHESLALVCEAQVPDVPDAPPELDAIVRKALAKDVADRYQSLGELAAVLAEYLVGRARN